MRFSKFLTATSVAAISLALASNAFAQAPAVIGSPTGDDAAGLEIVVVTAQKRTENLQDTPISMSVLTANALENRNVVSLVDLGDGAIPSLKVAPFFSRPGALIMNIRGIGVLSDSNQPARDQGVGVYVDGVYLGRPQGLGTALYDIAGIEVLKGPQGTLFGRNTEGGAVNIITKKPSGRFKLDTTTGVGNFGAYKTEVHLDLPTFADISVKIDGVVALREGIVDNPLASAKDFGTFDKQGFRIAAIWQPADNFTADYAYDNAYDATSTNYLQLLQAGTLRVAQRTTVGFGRAKVASTGNPQKESIGTTSGHRLTLDWKFNDALKLKYIGSSRELVQDQWDNANTPTSQFTTTNTFIGAGFARYSLALFTQDQSSHEIQIIGETPRLKYVAGALYYRENVQDDARAFNTLAFTDAVGQEFRTLDIDYSKQRIDRASKVQTTSVGVFGQLTWTPQLFDDRTHLTVGGRWTEDQKVGQLFTVNGALPIVNGVSAPRDLNTTWDRFDPLVNLSFDVTKDIMIYAKHSSGYKSGGANSRSLFYAPFNPESVSMNEIGAKIEFWNRRARLNLAAYQGIYKDIQLDFAAQYQQIDPVTGLLISTLRTTTETTNAPGEGDLSGFEADFTLAPTQNLTLSASFAYNVVEIPATINPFRQANGQLITVPIPIYQVYTPERSASISADYDRPFMGATFLAHIDANYDSGYYANYTDVAYDPVTRAVTVPQPIGDKAYIVNARLALADIDVRGVSATVSIWSRNLLNEEHVFYKTKSVLGGVSGFYNEPRTYGFEIKIKN